MAHYLDMATRQQVIALLRLDWSYRRIARETGIHRKTIRRYAAAWRAKCTTAPADPPLMDVPPPERPRHAYTAAPFATEITQALERGLTAQRIYQDLVETYGYAGSYDSVKRFARHLKRHAPVRMTGVMHHAPAEEAQVDYFTGAPTWHPTQRRYVRPWVFRMTLCHSRHGYEEAVWTMDLVNFMRLHEHAFRDFGGVPQVIRHDNLRAGVSRAALYDPDSNTRYLAFAQHWGFASLPTKPKNPPENGKEERSGGYCKHNACAGHRFPSLAAHNAHLRQWNQRWARTRIHGTTRRQVWAHFVEVERPALQPCPQDDALLFECGTRRVHIDGHVEVLGAFYPVPPQLLKTDVHVRWDERLVRIFHAGTHVAVYARVPPGHWALRPGQPESMLLSTQVTALEQMLRRTSTIGAPLRTWAEAAHAERGVRTFRLLQGVLGLARTAPRAAVLEAARAATELHAYRYAAFKRLLTHALTRAAHAVAERSLTTEHPAIRSMQHYTLTHFTTPSETAP